MSNSLVFVDKFFSLAEILIPINLVKYDMLISGESMPQLHIAFSLMASFGCYLMDLQNT